MYTSNMYSMRLGVTGMGKGEMKLSRVAHVLVVTVLGPEFTPASSS